MGSEDTGLALPCIVWDSELDSLLDPYWLGALTSYAN